MLCSDDGDGFDFHEDVLRKTGHLYGGTGRVRRREKAGVNLVEPGEIAHVAEKHRGFDNVFHPGAGNLQHGPEIFERLASLRDDIALDDGAAFRVQRDLARGKNDAAGSDRLGVRADRGRGARSVLTS